MLVYVYMGSEEHGPLRALVNVYFMHKGVMVKPLCIMRSRLGKQRKSQKK